MRKSLGGVCLLSVLVMSSLAGPVYAEHDATIKRTVIASRYDGSKEVTLEGTVQELVRKPAPGSVLGAHLLVSTAKGTIDAHIGSFILQGEHAFSPVAGQPVKIVGVMATINHRDIFLTRTIETGDRTIEIRNEHGFFILPGVKAQLVHKSIVGGAR